MLTLLVACAEAASTPALGKLVHVRERQLLGRAFTSDLEAGGAPGDLAQEIEFFQTHDARLKSAEGLEPVYGERLSRLRGRNIVLVSLQSVRARDLPMRGGPAVMPFLSSLRDHCVTLDRLYAQDTRSTKTFAAFDLGVYELISWESYSHGLTRELRADSVAARLKVLGYRTHVLVNGDPSYDANATFHQARGYDDVLYQPEITPGSSNSDDLKLLAKVDELLSKHDASPAYFFVWPVATHHPYGREYWADIDGWQARHPEGIQHKRAEDDQRYLAALTEADDFPRRLSELFAAHGRPDTTFFFVGDHGEAFGDHDPRNVFHGNDVYEEAVLVAGLVCSPSLATGGSDGRVMMIKDVAASIVHLGGAEDPVLGNGRSVFAHYRAPMSAYLFNSFARTTGIISEGFKYRTSLEQTNQRYFAYLDEIAKNPDAELKPAADDPRAAAARAELEAWLRAMTTRTRRLLTGTLRTFDNLVVDDYFRVYCDEGSDFVEAVKATGGYHTTGDELVRVEVPLSRACRRLRLAPFLNTAFPEDVLIHVTIEDVQVATAAGAVLPLSALTLEQTLNGEPNGSGRFTTRGGGGSSPCLDFALGPAPVPLTKVSLSFKLQGRQLRRRP